VVAKRVVIIGEAELHSALTEMLQRMGDLTLITNPLEGGMRKYAHVITGYMKSSIFHNRMIAGADATYAGFEADRGGEHDFAQKAIFAFPAGKYLDEIVEPF